MKLSLRIALAVGFFLGLGLQWAVAQPKFGNAFQHPISAPAGKFDALDSGVLNVNGPTGIQGPLTCADTIQGNDVQVPTNRAVYLNGTTRTVGFSFDGTNLRVLQAAGAVVPGADQQWNLGTSAIRVSNAYFGGDVQLGTGTATTGSVAAGTLSVISTAVGNVGASGPDDLMTYSLPANSLVGTNRAIQIYAWGTCANNANAKTFTLNFGSQVILTHACTVSVANERWSISAVVVRTGASAQDWWSEYRGNTGAAGAFEFDPEIGTATQTETGAIDIKMQSTVSTSNNDIVQEGMVIKFL